MTPFSTTVFFTCFCSKIVFDPSFPQVHDSCDSIQSEEDADDFLVGHSKFWFCGDVKNPSIREGSVSVRSAVPEVHGDKIIYKTT